MTHIGKNIKELRNKKNMSRADIANKSGISEISIRKYENEERNPKLENIIKIAKALDVAIMELLIDENDFVDSELSNKIILSMSDTRPFYAEPSIIEKGDEELGAYGAVEEFLKRQVVQKELGYKYMEFMVEENFKEIYEFIIGMLKMKIAEIKSREIK